MNNKTKDIALELPRPLINQILAHAQQNPDEEICGLISSKSQDSKIPGSEIPGSENCGAANYYRIANIAEDKAHRFEMSGPQQIAAMKKMRAQGEALLAIVHSHPDAPAIPSALDKENNNYPDVYYLVVSLNTKGVLELRCFLLNEDEGEDKFKPAKLVLELPPAAY